MNYSVEEIQLIIKLNIDSILTKEVNLNHLYSESNCINEKKINSFLTSSTLKSEKVLKEFILNFSKEFSIEEKELYDDTIYRSLKKYHPEFKLINIYKDEGTKLIKGGAKTLLSQLGDQGIDSIVINVLQGGNVRDTTELITRTKLLISNASILDLFLSFNNEPSEDLTSFFDYLKKNIQLSPSDSENTLLSLWLLGLNKKSLANIVRGRSNIKEYTLNLNDTVEESLTTISSLLGDLSGSITLGSKNMNLNWANISLLFMAIGAQTLTIRGSDKSTNGKFFEKLILGSSLSMMGFNYVKKIPDSISPSDKLFVLSTTETDERETDATVIFNNKAVSIDIGFIGGGNPEISADKVTRFRSDKTIGKITNSMVPLIIVDTINNDTVIKKIANELNGEAIEMRDKFWIKNMAMFLSNYFETDCHFEKIDNLDLLHKEIEHKLKNLDLAMFANIEVED